jgi:hypothetical protein
MHRADRLIDSMIPEQIREHIDAHLNTGTRPLDAAVSDDEGLPDEQALQMFAHAVDRSGAVVRARRRTSNLPAKPVTGVSGVASGSNMRTEM